MTMLMDDQINSALTGLGPRLSRVAAGTLGLMLALCFAGLAQLLTFDEMAATLGFVVGGGLIISRAIVGDALERTGLRGQRDRSQTMGQHKSSGRPP
jgi:hypothetical protein